MWETGPQPKICDFSSGGGSSSCAVVIIERYRAMVGATVVVKNLGDENIEKAVCESLLTSTRRYEGWTVRVMGADDNDKWVVRVESPFGIKSQRDLTLHDNQTAQRVVQIVIELIASSMQRLNGAS
jgi:hypothetical protein